jgi:hypothetical protein
MGSGLQKINLTGKIASDTRLYIRVRFGPDLKNDGIDKI